jgi:hypothetical protein
MAKRRRLLQCEWADPWHSLWLLAATVKHRAHSQKDQAWHSRPLAAYCVERSTPKTDTKAFLARALRIPLKTLAAVADGEKAVEAGPAGAVGGLHNSGVSQ